MKTASEWDMALRSPTAAAEVAAEARVYLSLHASPHSRMSTVDLAEALYPLAEARGEAVTVRNKMMNILVRLAKSDLADCRSDGPVKVKFNVASYPSLWHSPTAPDPAQVKRAGVKALLPKKARPVSAQAKAASAGVGPGEAGAMAGDSSDRPITWADLKRTMDELRKEFEDAKELRTLRETSENPDRPDNSPAVQGLGGDAVGRPDLEPTQAAPVPVALKPGDRVQHSQTGVNGLVVMVKPMINTAAVQWDDSKLTTYHQNTSLVLVGEEPKEVTT